MGLRRLAALLLLGAGVGLAVLLSSDGEDAAPAAELLRLNGFEAQALSLNVAAVSRGFVVMKETPSAEPRTPR